MDAKLIDTTTEDRDGATWVTGRCPLCWERCAVRAPAIGVPPTLRCPNGHSLELVERHSGGPPEA